MIKEISAKRLMDGGAAMLQIDSRSHHIEKAGKSLRIPLVKNILRVFVLSYVMLARLNMQEEHKPWAIIMARAPCHPHEEHNIAPMITNAMWPTEE